MMFKVLFNTEKFPTFQEALIKCIQKVIKDDSKILNNKDSELDFHFWTYIQASGVVSRIRYWILHDFIFSKEYLAEQTLKQIQFKSTKFLFETKV